MSKRQTLNEFENAVLDLLERYDCEGGYFLNETIKRESKKLLEIARNYESKMD